MTRRKRAARTPDAGGIKTDAGGRPVTDKGGRPVNQGPRPATTDNTDQDKDTRDADQ